MTVRCPLMRFSGTTRLACRGEVVMISRKMKEITAETQSSAEKEKGGKNPKSSHRISQKSTEKICGIL
jgi:hypothetical protein